MNVAAVLDRLESQGVTITVTDDQVKLLPGSRVPSDLVEQLKHHKKEVVAFLRGSHTQSANPPVGDDSPGLPADICGGFPKAQVELATAINNKFGITDPSTDSITNWSGCAATTRTVARTTVSAMRRLHRNN